MPSDISAAVEQDQIAESLLGESDEAQQETQQTVAEESNAATEDASTENAGELSEATEETADDWLPTEQEKVFPAEVLEKYAPRYGFTAEELAGDPRIARIVQDKLNSDIYINQLQQQSELEETADEVVAQPKQEPTQQQLTTQQWMQQVDRVAESLIDPEIASMFASQFLSTFGVKDAPTPEVARGLTKVMTTFGLNLMNTVLPQMLNSPSQGGKTFFQDLMERNYEGFSETHEMTNYERAWTRAASGVKELSGKSLRELGPQLEEAATRFAGSPEEFENMQFRGKDGKPLSPYQNAVKKYSVLAKMIAGQKITPQEAQTFVQAGKKAAQRQQMQRQLGNLGSGKSNQQITSKQTSGKFQTNNDLFDDEAMAIYKQQHGSL